MKIINLYCEGKRGSHDFATKYPDLVELRTIIEQQLV